MKIITVYIYDIRTRRSGESIRLMAKAVAENGERYCFAVEAEEQVKPGDLYQLKSSHTHWKHSRPWSAIVASDLFVGRER